MADKAIPCLKEKIAFKELSKMVNAIAQTRREMVKEGAPLIIMPHFQFKDEKMAQSMVMALWSTMVAKLGENVVCRELRDHSWKAGERKLIMAVGITEAQLEGVLAGM